MSDAPLQASLSFQPSAAAHALVQQSVASLQARRRAAELDRRQLMASVNERRCSAQPSYGEDLLSAVHVEFPVHHVNIIREEVVFRLPDVYNMGHKGCRHLIIILSILQTRC